MSWKMGFQWRRNAKGPLTPPAFSSHGAVGGIIYLPLATRRRRRYRRSGSNRSGGKPCSAIAGARQSLAIIQTSLGHSALRRARRGSGPRRPLHTTTTLHFVRFLSARGANEQSRSFVCSLALRIRPQSVSPCCNISARVIAFVEDSR